MNTLLNALPTTQILVERWSFSGVEMFRRSLPRYNIRYKYYLGDGDSQSYPAVVSAQPYGPEFTVEKLECVGHVQKRIGSRLGKLKTQFGKRKLSDDKTIGGRGRLTNAVINEIKFTMA